MTEDLDQDNGHRVDLDDELDLDQDTALSTPGELLDLEAPPRASAPALATPRPTAAPKPPQHTPARSDPRPAPTLQGARPVTTPTPRPTPRPAARRPKALTRTDVVPEFRSELRITPGAGGYDVCDPTTGQAHPLNEYEVSLARMLDGRRPVFEVLEAGERLGIPINLESLQKFISLLEQYGFLRPPESLDAALDIAVDNAWSSQGQRENSANTLFQSGIRFLRQGKPAEAASYFEVLLAEEPDNVEARELLAMANQSLAAAAPQPSQLTSTPHAETPLVVAPTPLSVQLPTMQEAPQPLPVRRGMLWRYVLIGGGAVIVAVIALLVAYLQRSADRAEPVIAKTDPPSPTTPAVVAAPTAPGPPTPGPPTPEVVAVPTTSAPTTPDPTKPEGSEAPSAPAVTRVEAPSAGELRSFLRAPRQVRKGEKLFEIVRVDGDPVKIKQRQLDVEEMRSLAKQDPDYQAFLADARSELAKVKKVVVVMVKAPKDGKASPKANPGTTVRGGDVLAEIE